MDSSMKTTMKYLELAAESQPPRNDTSEGSLDPGFAVWYTLFA